MENVRKLISASKIKRSVKKLGKQITKDYSGKQPVIICMLKGAVYFFSDLIKNIKLPIMIDFARLSSYKHGWHVKAFIVGLNIHFSASRFI